MNYAQQHAASIKTILSNELLTAIKEKIDVNLHQQTDWSTIYQLKVSQINKLLALPDGLKLVFTEIYAEQRETFEHTEMTHLRQIVNLFIEAIALECKRAVNTITMDEIDAIIKQYNLQNLIKSNFDVDRLLENCQPLRVVIQLDLLHDFNGSSWRNNMQYEQAQQVLTLFNINPRKILDRFPNMRYRDGYEYLLPENLVRLWDSVVYSGQYVIPVCLDLLDYEKDKNSYQYGIVLEAGTSVWLHDYQTGNCSISVPLEKALTIRRDDLNYFFGDDRQTIGRSLSTNCALSQGIWHKPVAAVITQKDCPYRLPAVRKTFRYFMVGTAVTDIQFSVMIAAFSDTGTLYGKSVKSGTLMQQDIKEKLWDDFPTTGRKYLHEEAERSSKHCVLQIKESIGQIEFVHAQVIVEINSAKVVWSETSPLPRSKSIMYHFQRCLYTLIKKEGSL